MFLLYNITREDAILIYVCLFLMLVLQMKLSPLTEYCMKGIGVVLRIYEWVLFYAAVFY